MNVTYAPEVRQPAESFEMLQKASVQLGEVAGKYANAMSAAWDKAFDNRGQPIYRLTIEHPEGHAQIGMSSFELGSPNLLKNRLHHIMGDLLQVKIDKILQNMRDESQE